MRLLALFLLLLSLEAQAVNLIPNGGFEVGVGRGLIQYGTSDDSFAGNFQETKGYITNDAHSGRYSFIAKGTTISRTIWLTAGQKMFSMWAKCSNPGAGPFYFGIVAASELQALPIVGTTNIAGTWTRYTLGFTAPSNGFYHFGCNTLQTSHTFQLDDLQLEDGTSATTYAPSAAVELGMSMTATNRMWYAGDTPAVVFNFWNDGIATNARVHYLFYDMYNSNVLSGDLTIALAASTNTTYSLVVPARYGWFRVVTRLLDVNGSYDEMDYCYYPFAYSSATDATNDWLGGHSHGSLFHSLLEKKKNRKWTRTLSPNYANTRWDYLEATRGATYTFVDSYITNLTYQGINVIATLTPSDTIWPTWATNANGSADLMAWSNYCFKVVAHLTALGVKYYEVGPNEPLQSGPTGFGPTYNSTGDHHAGGTNLPINVQVATNYTKCMAYGIAGITNADPAVKIIVGAGAFGDGSWTDEAITNLSANLQSWISIVSTHNYGADQGADPNDGVYTEGNAHPHATWLNYFGSRWQVWNTEGGAYYGASSFKGLNGLLKCKGGFDLYASYSQESGRGEMQQRQLNAVDRFLPEALRCIGYRFSKVFYYDSRYFNNSSFDVNSLPYPASFTQVDHPHTLTLSVAASMVRAAFGPVTNTTAGTYLEAYVGTNASGQAVLWVWANDKTNKTVTLDNSNYAVIDESGNRVQTNVLAFKATRIPQYLVSGTRTVAQLSNSFVGATVVSLADTLAPQVSIDIAPSGLWSGATNAELFKWTAIDDTVTAWTTSPHSTNVVYKYKMDSGSYGAYSQSNYVWYPNISSGNHTFYVTASDASGNTMEVSYEFSPAAISSATTINANTVNAGTLNFVH